MPQIVDVDTTAGDVKPGDVFRQIDGGRADQIEITYIKTGSKWTEARDDDHSLIFRRLNTDQVWVQREVPTQEELDAAAAERKAQADEWRLDMLTKLYQRMHDGVHAARTALAAKLAEPGGFVSASILENLIMEQEYKTIACQIEAGLKHHDDWTMLDCMNAVADKIKEGLINGLNQPTQSGGFTFNNAERQLKTEAQRKFIQGINWGIL